MWHKQFWIAVCLVLPVLCWAQQPPAKLLTVAKIDQIMHARSSVGDFSGTVLVARQGKVLYH